MQAEVLEYTTKEGGEWLDWDFKTFKPSNPELNTMGIPITGSVNTGHVALFRDDTLGISVFVHSLRLSDGREWDCVNGWRK